MEAVIKSPIREQVYRRILHAIIHGIIPPNTRMKDTEIAEELRISRTPVREALVQLENDGFIESHPGRGFWVRNLEAKEVEETYPILSSLESLAMQLTGQFQSVHLESLAPINQNLNKSAGDIRSRIAIDAKWHTLLVSQCENRKLLQLIDQHRDVVSRYELAYMKESDGPLDSVRDHRMIVELLEHGDLTGARKQLIVHWDRSSALLLSLLNT